jgi:hypothetical protein
VLSRPRDARLLQHALRITAIAALLILFTHQAIGGQRPIMRTTPPVPAPAPARPATLYAVGDVMYRTTSEGAHLVGDLLERLLARDPANSRAIVAGDVCNDDGQPECYERLERTPWSRLRPLLFPVPAHSPDCTLGLRIRWRSSMGRAIGFRTF